MPKWTPDKVEEAAASRGRRCQGREMMAKRTGPSTIVVHGPDAAHHRQRDGARVVHPATGARQHRRVRWRRQHLPRPRQRAGATDVGPNPDSLPGYYGLATGSWKHWAAVWGVDYEWKKQYAPKAMMESPAPPVSRWIDAVLGSENDVVDQDQRARDGVLGPCAQQPDARPGNEVEAMKKLDLMVVIDPYPSATAGDGGDAASPGRPAVYLLPACTQFEPPVPARRPTARSSGARRSSSRCGKAFDHMIMVPVSPKVRL